MQSNALLALDLFIFWVGISILFCGTIEMYDSKFDLAVSIVVIAALVFILFHMTSGS